MILAAIFFGRGKFLCFGTLLILLLPGYGFVDSPRRWF